MIVEYKGRKIKLVRVKRDGFPAIAASINNLHVWTYQGLTPNQVLAQTRCDIDACDANPTVAYEAHWYADGDPRKAARIVQLGGDPR